MYDESADSNLGPFTVDARLTSVGGSVLYATGEGRVSNTVLDYVDWQARFNLLRDPRGDLFKRESSSLDNAEILQQVCPTKFEGSQQTAH